MEVPTSDCFSHTVVTQAAGFPSGSQPGRAVAAAEKLLANIQPGYVWTSRLYPQLCCQGQGVLGGESPTSQCVWPWLSLLSWSAWKQTPRGGTGMKRTDSSSVWNTLRTQTLLWIPTRTGTTQNKIIITPNLLPFHTQAICWDYVQGHRIINNGESFIHSRVHRLPRHSACTWTTLLKNTMHYSLLFQGKEGIMKHKNAARQGWPERAGLGGSKATKALR